MYNGMVVCDVNASGSGMMPGFGIIAFRRYRLWRRCRPGQWFHIAFTWDTSSLRMYLDGVLVNIRPRETPEWKAARRPTIRLSHECEWLCLSGVIRRNPAFGRSTLRSGCSEGRDLHAPARRP